MLTQCSHRTVKLGNSGAFNIGTIYKAVDMV